MKTKKRSNNRTLHVINIMTLVACLLLASDVFYVAIGKMHLRSHTNLTPYIDSANLLTETTKALRGNIFDIHGNIIAQDSRTYNIICILSKDRPSIEGQISYVDNKEYTAEVLAKCLKADYNQIYDLLNQDVYQTELGNIGRGISKSVKDEIESYNLPGIEFSDAIQRAYPIGQFSSHLVGYAQPNEKGTTVGRMGIELYLNSYLEGKDGSRTYQVDQYGYVLPGMKETVVNAENGNNVYLTLNSEMQKSLEEALSELNDIFHFERAWAGVMEAKTGRILAWGQSPSFDPNYLDNIVTYNDMGTSLPYEPGSTLKTFTWAAAMNEGKYDGSAVTDGNQYCFVSDKDNNPIRTYSEDNYGCVFNANERKYGTVDMDTGLIKSLNTVAAAIQNEVITPDTHMDYMKKFGFFKEVKTDGIPDASGFANFTWAAEKVTLSYGHGSSVTMLQLLQAYSALFGDGRPVKPYFVESIRDYYDNNRVIYQAETEYLDQAVTEETTKSIRELLERCIYTDGAAATFYKIDDVRIGGKTGTTIVAEDGDYKNSLFNISSIMVGMPINDPQLIIYFAFEAIETPKNENMTKPITDFYKKAAILYGLTNNQNEDKVEGEEETATNQKQTDIKKYEMPNLVNHSLDYANKKLEGKEANVIILGDGDTVVSQFPNENSSIYSGQRVMLNTSVSDFKMPDLTGWTRKDVTGLWSVTGVAFELHGEGVVKSQNVPPGTIVTKGTEIVIEFE